MSRCIVNVATGPYVLGQRRLFNSGASTDAFLGWANTMPPGSPSHYEIPYAFKAWALKAAAEKGHNLLLWADASILPIAPMASLWEKIERDGYWISKNGWVNAEWTCDSAYADLGVTVEDNWTIPHVVATAFGLNLGHPIGKAIFDEYFRLAQTRAFCGPWFNRNHPDYRTYPRTYAGRLWCEPCGPPTVRGARHDQAALSVLAWRNKVTLTGPPNCFSYRGGETESTILVADSTYML